MKICALILVSSFLFSFTSGPIATEKDSEKVESKKTVLQQEIQSFNEIIDSKINTANVLQEKAALLLSQDPNSEMGQAYQAEAKLQVMMTLKYRAAIACRMHLLEK